MVRFRKICNVKMSIKEETVKTAICSILPRELCVLYSQFFLNFRGKYVNQFSYNDGIPVSSRSIYFILFRYSENFEVRCVPHVCAYIHTITHNWERKGTKDYLHEKIQRLRSYDLFRGMKIDCVTMYTDLSPLYPVEKLVSIKKHWNFIPRSLT